MDQDDSDHLTNKSTQDIVDKIDRQVQQKVESVRDFCNAKLIKNRNLLLTLRNGYGALDAMISHILFYDPGLSLLRFLKPGVNWL